ncbi:MAG: GntR family transcriptional regulator [Pilosibacter sp.]
MVLKIDFDSEEALYTQLCNQIICGIAMDVLHDGDISPSVRQLADEIGINMHTVNKACCIETGRISCALTADVGL